MVATFAVGVICGAIIMLIGVGVGYIAADLRRLDRE